MAIIYVFYTLFSLTLGDYFFITSCGPIFDFYQIFFSFKFHTMENKAVKKYTAKFKLQIV